MSYPPIVGQSAALILESHPELPGIDLPVVTSRVVKVGENGVFETKNTIYQKSKTA